MKKDCTTCKYGYEDEQLGIPMCHHPKRFSEDCVDFNMHEEKETETEHRGSSEIPNDLESYAQKVEDYYDVGEERGYLCVHRGGVKEAVIAGAQWQKEQMMREKQHDEFSSNVEQEFLNLNPYEHIVKCALDGVTRLGSLCDDKAIIDAAKLCVEKLNEQLMKEAIEGYVDQDFIVTESPFYFFRSVNLDLPNGFKEGDRVRIIVLPMEERL